MYPAAGRRIRIEFGKSRITLNSTKKATKILLLNAKFRLAFCVMWFWASQAVGFSIHDACCARGPNPGCWKLNRALQHSALSLVLRLDKWVFESRLDLDAPLRI